MKIHPKIILLQLLFSVTIFSAKADVADTNITQSLIRPDTVRATRNITITGVGDVMLGSSFPSKSFLPPHDNPFLLLQSVADSLKDSDITFANLEGSFLDAGEPAKKCRDTSLCYLFRMPERYVSTLTMAGFDVVSLANNHFGDFGQPSRSRTKTLLDSAGIHYAGLIEHPWSIFRKDSVLYGFCAFAPNAGTVNINDLEGAARIVRMLNDTCDIVIVSFHGGAEGKDFQNVPRKMEVFHGEERGDVYKFAHTMIDNGADVVFGQGPHVTRAIEVYRDRFISYSLGNFCTYGRFNLAGPNSLAPIVRLNVDASGKFISGRIIPALQPWPGGVKYDENRLAIMKIKELTAKDFPESVIEISDSGKIRYKSLENITENPVTPKH
jgi:hypothetical protein